VSRRVSRDLVGQPEFEVDLFAPFFHAPAATGPAAL
jgi:hypothetical protein